MNWWERITLKTYVMSDIHNNYMLFKKMLHAIHFSKEDRLFVLGDIFDRSNHNPNPVDLYFQVLSLGERCIVIRGNHDQWLAEYILDYFSLPERKRRKIEPYRYNSFELLRDRLTPIDLQNLAKDIMQWPLQLQVEINEERYLLSHAMTSLPDELQLQDYYLAGIQDEVYLERGIPGYISICGHSCTGGRIWKNRKGNLYAIDCGCGFRDGKLGCLCLETKEEFYV